MIAFRSSRRLVNHWASGEPWARGQVNSIGRLESRWTGKGISTSLTSTTTASRNFLPLADLLSNGVAMGAVPASSTRPTTLRSIAPAISTCRMSTTIASRSFHRRGIRSRSGESPVKPGEFGEGELRGLVVDGQGNIYVGDIGNNRIQKLSPAGRYLAQWAAPGGKLGDFSGHTEIAMDTQGNLYVSIGNRVLKLAVR